MREFGAVPLAAFGAVPVGLFGLQLYRSAPCVCADGCWLLHACGFGLCVQVCVFGTCLVRA